MSRTDLAVAALVPLNALFILSLHLLSPFSPACLIGTANQSADAEEKGRVENKEKRKNI